MPKTNSTTTSQLNDSGHGSGGNAQTCLSTTVNINLGHEAKAQKPGTIYQQQSNDEASSKFGGINAATAQSSDRESMLQ